MPTRSWGATSSPGSRSRRSEPLSIDVAYDRTHLAQDDIATASATVRNNLDKTANMVMVDLGIPPGFDLLSEDLQDYQEKSAGLQEWPLVEVQPYGDAGHSLLRFVRSGRYGYGEVPSAGQVSYPREDIQVASLRVLRSRGKLGRAARATGGAQTLTIKLPTVRWFFSFLGVQPERLPAKINPVQRRGAEGNRSILAPYGGGSYCCRLEFLHLRRPQTL